MKDKKKRMIESIIIGLVVVILIGIKLKPYVQSFSNSHQNGEQGQIEAGGSFEDVGGEGEEDEISYLTAEINEECEECGMFYTVKSVDYEKMEDTSDNGGYRFTILCHVRNGRSGEKVDLQKVAEKFSVSVGNTEEQGKLDGDAKKLQDGEQCDIKIQVDLKEADVSGYQVFYTYEELNEKKMQVFRQEILYTKGE